MIQRCVYATPLAQNAAFTSYYIILLYYSYIIIVITVLYYYTGICYFSQFVIIIVLFIILFCFFIHIAFFHSNMLTSNKLIIVLSVRICKDSIVILYCTGMKKYIYYNYNTINKNVILGDCKSNYKTRLTVCSFFL